MKFKYQNYLYRNMQMWVRRYYEGDTYVKISVDMGITPKRVRDLVWRWAKEIEIAKKLPNRYSTDELVYEFEFDPAKILKPKRGT